MKLPPKELDGARVLRYAIVDSSIAHTGKLSIHAGGAVLGPCAGLAICRYDGEDDVYLFHCSDRWEVLGAGTYPTLESALGAAELGYRGVSTKWQARA